MRMLISALLCLVGLAVACHGIGGEDKKPPEKSSGEEIEKFVKDLPRSIPATREAASKALQKIGKDALPFLMSEVSQEREESNKRDEVAQDAAGQFLKGLLKKEKIETVMKSVDTPFFLEGMAGINDRDQLAKTLAELSESPSDVAVGKMYAFSSLPKDSLLATDLNPLKTMLGKSDCVVLIHVGQSAMAIGVRFKKEQARVVAMHSNLPLLALAFAVQESEKKIKSVAAATQIATATVENFEKAAKKKDLDELMKHVDVPWYSHGKTIKDREELKKFLKMAVEAADERQVVAGDKILIARYGGIREYIFDEKKLAEADQVFMKDDVVILLRREGKRIGRAFVRVSDGNGRIVGVGR